MQDDKMVTGVEQPLMDLDTEGVVVHLEKFSTERVIL